MAYFTYIYARVPGQHYQKVTSFTRAALLIGRFLSGVLSQVLVGFGLTGTLELNYISLAMVTVATLVSFLLPAVTNTIYFHRDTSSDTRPTVAEKCRRAFLLLRRDFVSSFSDPYIFKWSIWWALATCGNFQVKKLPDCFYVFWLLHQKVKATKTENVNKKKYKKSVKDRLFRLGTTYSRCGKIFSLMLRRGNFTMGLWRP